MSGVGEGLYGDVEEQGEGLLGGPGMDLAGLSGADDALLDVICEEGTWIGSCGGGRKWGSSMAAKFT